jgi:MFS superfamily sulfate permease-like transporter
MGYSLIAHVNPVFGLYTAFFPALLYTILGTSKHCAVGPVAIVAGLMTGNIVIAVMEDLGMNYQEKRGIGGIYNTSNTGIPEGFEDITNIDIAIMVGLINGVYVFTFGCLRLGFISNYLSEELVSGFMTSAAIYVFTTQLHYLVGVNLENRSGPLALIKTYIEFFERIKEVNLTALTISLICVAVLLFYILVVQKQLLKFKITMPFPIHLFIMIGGTVASNLMNLENEYNVQVVGNIPST